jgi:hypothetical protein
MWIVDQRYIRKRCHDRKCPDVIRAKAAGEVAIHVLDLQTWQQWTEYLPARAGQESTHGSDL